MNTNRLYALAAEHPRQSLSSKIVLIAAILALLIASLPVPSVLAAPSDEQPWEKIDLEKEWKNKLRNLQVESLFYNQTRFFPVDFENSDDLARAWDLLHKHGFALKQANTVVLSHSGFDFEGNVTNGRQAYETVHDLAMYLQMMRGLRLKIAEEGYIIHRAR